MLSVKETKLTEARTLPPPPQGDHRCQELDNKPHSCCPH